jgi:hypothetical protein
MAKMRFSSVADDDSGALFAQHTALLGLGAPVPTLFATEEAEHARRFLGVGIFLYKGGTLVSHLGPGAMLIENYLYASGCADAALRSALAVIYRAGERGRRDLGAVMREIIDMLATLRCR